MIVAIWGSEKTCKTTMALTFPKPLYHFDLDVGAANDCIVTVRIVPVRELFGCVLSCVRVDRAGIVD